MNKKAVILTVIALLLISASGLYFGRLLKNKQNSSTQSPPVVPTSTPVELTVWKDQSEFEFQYPKNLNLNTHPEDNENYAHLELTSSNYPGSIILWTLDSKYETVDDYIKGEKIANYIGSTLAEYLAVKILDSANSNKNSLLTIRNGFLYEIEMDSAGEKVWSDIFNSIIESYKFSEEKTMENPVNNTAPPAASEETYFEEEVIE